MGKGLLQKYQFRFRLQASAAQLWPLISDTNRNFRLLGATPIHKTSLSRNAPKGFLELSHNLKNSLISWEEAPYIWEKPYRLGFRRDYKTGLLKVLQVQVDLQPVLNATSVAISINIQPTSTLYSFVIKFYLEQIIKRRLEKLLSRYDNSLMKGVPPYELNVQNKLSRPARNKLKKKAAKLTEATNRKRIVNHLTNLLIRADDDSLHRIHPFTLAEHWGEKKFAVLNVFLHAAKLDILDFSWDNCCPYCKAPKNNFRKMAEIRDTLYCDDCELEYTPDFNKNMHLVFKPHPLIRKLSSKVYCLGGPHTRKHRVFQRYLLPGDTHYLNISLDVGTYLLRTDSQKGDIKLHVREDGDDNFTIYLSDELFTGNDEITISPEPNLIIVNSSESDKLCYIDSLNWQKDAICATEVTSSPDFNALFSKEIVKESSKIKATEVTLLFTDLMDSTGLYVQEGDELAIGRVMSHFKIIQHIVAEERGGIVKTIGDSVMAVFREPVSALKAVERIQQIFTRPTGGSESFKLKAGIHHGNCTAVNLNGRIDYFGTTVNIAARLVGIASEKELMVSEAVYNHPDVRLYLEEHSGTFFVKDTLQELKGFEDKTFKVKQIRMERPKLRLVI